MSLSYKSIVGSDTFTFLVGPEAKRYTLHSKLVAYHSKPLNVLINGPMAEAKQNFAVLKDVDEHTFARFCHYAYTGEYDDDEGEEDNVAANADDPVTLPKIVRKEAVPEIEGTTHNVFVEDMDDYIDDGFDPSYSRSVCKKNKRKSSGKCGSSFHLKHPFDDELLQAINQSKKSQLWDKFQEASHDKAMPSLSSSTTTTSTKHKSYAVESIGRILLCHAQVYVFAEQFNIKPLKELALNKLRCILITFKLTKEAVDRVVDLLKYVYENTVDMVNSEEKLRALVIHYAACQVEELISNHNFQSLLTNKGELGRDLVNKLASRLD